MSKRTKVAIVFLAALVAAGFIYLPRLYRQAVGLGRTPASEEAERRAVLQPLVSTKTDVTQPAQMYWLSASSRDVLAPTEEELKLSANPVERGKQLLAALINGPRDPHLRTLPPGASLLEFYLLPEGVAVADFSSELATELPSGIQSEQLAIESIADTLSANIPGLRKLKILIDGQEAQTLAGHIDLTGYFVLSPPASGPGTSALNGADPPELTGPQADGKLIR